MAVILGITWLVFVSTFRMSLANGYQLSGGLVEYLENMQAELEKKFDHRITSMEQKFEAEISKLKHEFTQKEDQYMTTIRRLETELENGREGHGDVRAPSLEDLKSNKESQHVTGVLTNHQHPATIKRSKIERKTRTSHVERKPVLPDRPYAKRQVSGEGSRVAFYASLTNSLTHLGQLQDIPFDKVVTNIGSGYNGHHGTFVAPVSGTYVLFTTLSTGHTWGHFVVNGNIIAKLGNAQQDGQTVIIHLSAGDDVSIQSTTLDGTIGGDKYSTFGGFLLYEDLQDVVIG